MEKTATRNVSTRTVTARTSETPSITIDTAPAVSCTFPPRSTIDPTCQSGTPVAASVTSASQRAGAAPAPSRTETRPAR